MCSFILKKLTKMSATVYFNTANHISCCDKHDVLGKSYTSSLVWDIAMTPYKWFTWFHAFEYICHILSDIQKSSFMLH